MGEVMQCQFPSGNTPRWTTELIESWLPKKQADETWNRCWHGARIAGGTGVQTPPLNLSLASTHTLPPNDSQVNPTHPVQQINYLRCMLVLYRYFTSSRSRDRAKKLGIHWLFMTIRFLVLGWIFCYCSDTRLYGCFCFSLFIQVECGSILESKCRTAVHYFMEILLKNDAVSGSSCIWIMSHVR